MTADQVGERGTGAAIGHMRQLDVGHHLEQHDAEMDPAADASRSVIELAGLLLG